MSIQFFDCPNCGKSLRVGARECHHCHAVDENDWQDPYAAEEYAKGGYAGDQDEGTSEPKRFAFGWWQRIGFVIIALLLILSFVLQSFLIHPVAPRPRW